MSNFISVFEAPTEAELAQLDAALAADAQLISQKATGEIRELERQLQSEFAAMQPGLIEAAEQLGIKFCIQSREYEAVMSRCGMKIYLQWLNNLKALMSTTPLLPNTMVVNIDAIRQMDATVVLGTWAHECTHLGQIRDGRLQAASDGGIFWEGEYYSPTFMNAMIGNTCTLEGVLEYIALPWEKEADMQGCIAVGITYEAFVNNIKENFNAK